jgi:DNA polymerase II small subunit
MHRISYPSQEITLDTGAETHSSPDSLETQDGTTGWQCRIEKSPTETMVGSEGVLDDFLDLFRDRYNRIRRIYMSRIDTQNAVSPDVAKMRRSKTRRTSMNSEGERTRRPPSQVVLGIIRNKNISKQRNVIIDLEGYEDSIICVIPSGLKGLQGQQLSDKADSLLLDEIVCISGYVDTDGRMIADDILFPDIPTARQIGRAKKEVYAAFISDIHCGSQEFLEDEFDRFIDWMNGHNVEPSDKNMVEKTRYLFIAGDLVDGISVYPEQREHLKISSLYDQYTTIAEKLQRLPKSIRVFCIPGNHDASRQALPKPPIPRIFAEPLYALENVTMLGDPSQILVEGVNILMTHGDSLDDLVTTLPGASYTEPAKSMIELLKKRHLAPIYGGKTEIAPLHRDWMVIDTPPDVVHFGHAHHNAVDNYRGVQIINSGTFQSQTDFMRKQGVVPTPGIVTFLNLQTGAPEIRFFYDLSNQ